MMYFGLLMAAQCILFNVIDIDAWSRCLRIGILEVGNALAWCKIEGPANTPRRIAPMPFRTIRVPSCVQAAGVMFGMLHSSGS